MRLIGEGAAEIYKEICRLEDKYIESLPEGKRYEFFTSSFRVPDEFCVSAEQREKARELGKAWGKGVRAVMDNAV